MAYVNVLEWKCEQVAEWLQGLDESVVPYTHFFINNNVTGQGLLNLAADDLYKLHVEKLGHQEIILEALELLRNLHHNLDTENLQYVCLRVSCKARSLYNELRMYGPPKEEVKQTVSTPTMAAVADVLDSVTTLISWLDRPPFHTKQHYITFKTNLLRISLELATSAQRGTFAERPVDVIKDCCDKLSNLSDELIQGVNDTLILQPGSLDVATVKRKTAEEDFGIVFESATQPGVHIIAEVKFQSPADHCGKIEPGDEVVQIGFQTVVGWQTKRMLQLITEPPSELILTLKKRPRHSPVFGMYMKPFRIPARQKRPANYFKYLPSPRADLLVAPKISFPLRPCSKAASVASLNDEDLILTDIGSEDSDDDSAFLPPLDTSTRSKSPTQSIRSVLSRPRSTPQRRATISGSSPSLFRPYMNISEIWGGGQLKKDDDLKVRNDSEDDSGMSTMSGEAELRRKPDLPGQRPVTVAAFEVRTEWSSAAADGYENLPSKPNYVNMSLDSGFGSIEPKQPLPKPRTESVKKKPIPQPRKKIPDSSRIRSILPDKVNRPVPTASFKSFRKPSSDSGMSSAASTPTKPAPPAPTPPRPTPPPPPVIPAKRLPAPPPPRPPPATPPPRPPGKPEGVVLRSKSSTPRRFSGDYSHRFGVVSPDRRSSIDAHRLSGSECGRSSVSSSDGRVPYYVSDVYREGSPEKNWIDSLRSGREAAEAARVAEKMSEAAKMAERSRLRSTHSYQPIPQSQDQLKFAFDMELLGEQTKEAPDFPPMFNPATYSLQDFSRNHQQ